MPIATLMIKVAMEMGGFNSQLKEIKSNITGLDSTVKGLAKSLGAYFSVTAIVGAVNAVLDFAGAMTDLSARTGVSTTALQEFSAAGAQVGVSIDSVVTAIGQMQNRLGSGDKGATSAIGAMGLELDALMAMKPEDQFKAIAKGIAGIEDPARRTATAMDVFGRSAGEVLPLLVANMDEMIRAAHDMGLVLDEEAIENLDNLGDAMTSLMGAGKALLAEVLVPLAPALVDFANELMGAARAAHSFAADWYDAMVQLKSEGYGAMAKAAAGAATLAEKVGMPTAAVGKLKEMAFEFGYVSERLSTEEDKLATSITKVGEAMGHVAGQDITGLIAQTEQIEKINKLSDQLFGRDLIQRAKEYADAVRQVGGAAHMTADAQQDIIDASLKAMGVMERERQTASALYAELTKLAGRTANPEGGAAILGSGRVAGFDQTFNAAPVAEVDAGTKALLLQRQALIDNTATWETELQTQQQLQDENDARIAASIAETARQQKEASDQMVGGWRAVTAAKAEAFQLNVPKGFSFTKAYRDAGLFVSERGGELMGAHTPFTDYPSFASGTDGYQNFGTGTPAMLHGWEKVTPLGAAEGGGAGGAVVVNVSGVLLSNNPAAREELRRFVSETLTDSLKRSRKFSTA
jgi:hypothetical protein